MKEDENLSNYNKIPWKNSINLEKTFFLSSATVIVLYLDSSTLDSYFRPIYHEQAMLGMG